MNRLWKKQSVVLALFGFTLLISAQVGYALIVSGTKIATTSGDTAIESMRIGDQLNAGTMGIDEFGATIVTWNTQYHIYRRNPVSYFSAQNYMIKITYGDNKQLIVSPEQPFLLGSNEIKSANQLVPNYDLLLKNDNTSEMILSVTTVPYYTGTVYGMVIDSPIANVNNYAVIDNHFYSANGIVVGDYFVEILWEEISKSGPSAFPLFDNSAILGNSSFVTMEEGAQQFPDVAYNSKNNTYLVVWEHTVFDDLYEIRGTIVSGDGVVGNNSILLLSDEYSLEAPEIVYNGKANEYLLVARRKNDNMVLGQRISAGGQPVGDPVEIGVSNGPTFFDPAARARVVSVAYNSMEDRYIVAFGEPMSVQIIMPDLSIDLQSAQLGIGSNPSIAYSSKSNVYLMAYEDREIRSTGPENLSAIVIDNIADALTDIIRIRDQEFAEESPRVAYNSDDDQFLIVWDERIGFSEGLNPQTLTDTIGQIVTADGTPVGQPIKIEAGTAYTLRQDVDYNPTSQVYLVVWKGDESGDFAFADILGQFINRDGSLNGSTFTIFDNGDDNTDMGNSEQYYDESKLPAVTANTKTGEFLVVWEEGGTYRSPELRDIMCRSVSLPSTPVADWALFE